MAICTKCGKEVSKTRNCEHTDDKEFCTECYTELHYYMTEPESK